MHCSIANVCDTSSLLGTKEGGLSLRYLFRASSPSHRTFLANGKVKPKEKLKQQFFKVCNLDPWHGTANQSPLTLQLT